LLIAYLYIFAVSSPALLRGFLPPVQESVCSNLGNSLLINLVIHHRFFSSAPLISFLPPAQESCGSEPGQ